MKKFNYMIAAVLMGMMLYSCQKLDLEPKGLLYENVLLSSDNGVKKYLALVYQDLPIEDFNYGQDGDQRGYATVNANGWHSGNIWQAQKSSAASASGEACGRALQYGDSWGYWPYDRIRDINNMIEQLPNYKENYTEEAYNALMGEAHFLRAFYYFGIVKRYGGVPIVDKVLDPKADVATLSLPRSTEYDCWKFIYSDLDFAMKNASTSRAELGRANRYAAAALMSRAMLYAGSIAKYSKYIATTGPAVDKGLMTMSPEYAEEFFQYSYNAAKFLQDAGFRLHDNGGDKVQNYREVFIGENSADEDIMIKQYGPKSTVPVNTSLFHCWDTMVLPLATGLSSDVGAAIQPSWELIRLYEMPAITDDNGNPVRFNDPKELWDTDKMEARCKANFLFTGMEESGVTIDIQAGVYTEYPGTAADGTADVAGSINEYTDKYRHRAARPGEYQTINGQEVKVSGVHGLGEGTGDEGYSYMGTCIRKYVDYNMDPANRVLFGCNQSWKVFRYGEILCNWAEAAYELGLIRDDNALKEEAFDHINELRRRAGATEHAMVASPEDVGTDVYGFLIDENLQYIREERQRELCFENHHIFDIRRWRIADILFRDGMFTHTLSSYYVMSEDKWIFLNEVNKEGRKVNFYKRWYYEQMPGGAISTNPNIIRNDGY